MRGPLLWLVGIAGCYSPTVATGIPCAPDGAGARCPPDQECISRGNIELCERVGSPGDLDASVVDATVDAPLIDAAPPANWWNLSWSRRRPIDVTAGANGAPADYSVSIVLDHAALVASGTSLASGNDVRIVRDESALEVDRSLDTGSAWNGSATTIWFSISAALAPNATVRYWVYYGNAAATLPPADPMSVFLYAEGFEGSLAAWSFDTGVGVSSTRAHRGTKSVATAPTSIASINATLDPFDETNVAWDVWWNIDTLSGGADMSQYVRGNATSVWFTNLQPPSGGGAPTWDISKVLSGTYSEVIPPPPGSTSPPEDTWFRVTLYAYGSRMAIDVAGTRYVPTTGFSDIGTVSSGDVGFGSYNSPGQVWFDDATLRRFVIPQPVLVLGAPDTL